MLTTAAIIIRLTRLTETSLIVHWFSEDHGLLKTVAKGAKRPKSPFAGQLDLFFGAEISLSHSPSRELHTLREVATRHWREGLRKNYNSVLLAAYFCQLIDSAVEPEHAEPELYNLLVRALDHLDSSPPSLRALRHFESELSRHLGIYHPERQADTSLRDVLGGLPSSRIQLVERLSPPQDFSSSDHFNPL